MAMWDLTGMRVKLGGRIAHTVALDAPIRVYGATRDRVIIDHEQVLQVADANCAA